MGDRFAITVSWERLARGRPEEQATFGMIGLSVGEKLLSEANDSLVNTLRKEVPLSGYLLAEWLAWNWWRLRWEPWRSGRDWAMAHHMGSIGGGYVWPNVTIETDGEDVLLTASATQCSAAEPLRYLSVARQTISAVEFEEAVDEFVEQVLGRLRSEGIVDSNLAAIWTVLKSERNDCESYRFRSIEAMLGRDPDAGDESAVNALVGDMQSLGENAVAELAFASRPGAPVVSGKQLEAFACTGSYTELQKLTVPSLGPDVSVAPSAWAVGEEAARGLRAFLGCKTDRLEDDQLATLAGVSPAVLAEQPPFPPPRSLL